MKRIVSAIMLLFMLLTVIQPTLSMHFCSKELKSIEVLAGASRKTCCRMMMSDTKSGSDDRLTTMQSESCCTSQNLQFATDDYYHHQTQNKWHHSILPSLDLLWIVLPFQSLRQADIMSLRKDFPPEGLVYLNRDILESISILRI